MHYHELIDDPHYITYRKSPIEHPTPGGETIPEVQARGVAAVMRTIEQHSGERVFFVSHGDIVRTVLCHFLKVELQHFHRLRIDNAALSAIQIAGEFAEVKFLNLMPDPHQAFVAPFSPTRTENKSD
jgi:broad specificity phosphatase PhoE